MLLNLDRDMAHRAVCASPVKILGLVWRVLVRRSACGESIRSRWCHVLALMVPPLSRGLATVLTCLALVPIGAEAAPQDPPPWPTERLFVEAMKRSVKQPQIEGERIWIRAMHAIRVGQNEDALLVSVWLPDRGRNFSSGTFLYRPKLKEARELEYGQSLGVEYVPGHYGRIGLLEQSGSGQGEEDFKHALVRFDGWKLQSLHEASFGNNLGACGDYPDPPRACEQTWVKFQLVPDQTPGGLDLIEVTTRMTGADRLTSKVVIVSRRLRLKGNRFVAIED